jgi:hypothetical protein
MQGIGERDVVLTEAAHADEPAPVTFTGQGEER